MWHTDLNSLSVDKLAELVRANISSIKDFACKQLYPLAQSYSGPLKGHECEPFAEMNDAEPNRRLDLVRRGACDPL